MIRNYFKIAFRNLWNNKVFSFINVIGLAIGLSASFVIGLMVYYDFSFDNFHPDSNRIYRITSDFYTPEGEFNNRGVSIPLGNKLKEGMTGIELTASFYTTSVRKIENSNTNKSYKNIDDIIYTDKNYFDVFPYKWLAGKSSEILNNPNEVVLTETRAAKYFPNVVPSEIVGRTLFYNDSIPIKVTGIVRDFEKRSDFIFQEFLSYKTSASFKMDDRILQGSWDGTTSANQVFIKIEESGKQRVQTQLDVLAKEHTSEDMIAFNQKREFNLQPLNDVHFNTKYGVFNNRPIKASKTVLVNLAFIALFLLLLGCINFINLNTANATKRSKEIGIRKTLGSNKRRLVFQFLGETFLLTLAAAFISLFFSVWLLEIFSDFIPNDLNFELFSNPIIIAFIAILLFVVTLLSGFYPAIVLSHFKPISVLKNQISSNTNKTHIRKYLTVFQFVIAQVFIIGTLLVGNQINYLLSKDMGFKTEALAYIKAGQDGDLSKRLTFINQIKSIPQVADISLGGNPPASTSTISEMATYFEEQNEIHTSVQYLFGDLEYQRLYDIKLLAGRNRLNDTIKEYIINETYLNFLGFKNPEDVLGKFIKVDNVQIPIVGVMEDFNQRSLKSNIDAMALVGDIHRGGGFSNFNTIHFAMNAQNTENWPKAIEKMESVWKTIYPNIDFEINFMDESISQFYEQEKRTSQLLIWATGLAILISCLGLLGLVIFTTEQRVKEIGVRKILGASILQLNVLLCREFLVLVGIAFIIAAPIAWWGINQWLQDFAFKTTVDWWIFLLSGVLMLMIALIIMSFKTIAFAKANPVESLRTE